MFRPPSGTLCPTCRGRGWLYTDGTWWGDTILDTDEGEATETCDTCGGDGTLAAAVAKRLEGQ